MAYFIASQQDSVLNFLKTHNNRVISSVGPRYTREVNIQTDYLNYFEPLLRTQKFKDSILRMTGELDRAVHDLHRSIVEDENLDKKKITKAFSLYELIRSLLFEITTNNSFPIKKLNKLFEKYEKVVFELRQSVRNREIKEIDKEKTNSWNHYYSKHYDSLSQLQAQVRSSETALYNKNILWLRGNAGEGKTHLLCDITIHRMNENKPSIILVGNDFNSSKDIWKTLCMHLNLDVSSPKSNFLKYIKETSLLFNERVLLVIDAINEGKGISAWKKQITSFVNAIKGSDFLSVCLSCRSTYEFFFDLTKVENHLIKVTHCGFQNNLLIAVKEYFNYYQIKYHEIPLVSEFSNPLFLQVYCKTIHRRKETGPYRGHKGMKDIIEKFFYKVDTDIIKVKLNYPTTIKSIKPSWEVAKLIAENMASNAQDYLTFQEAQTHAQTVSTKHGLQPGLLQEMVNEGLLIKDGHYEVHEEIIRFTYQKFSDHLIVRYLLNKYFDKENKTLDLNAPELKKLFEKNYLFEGLIKAMSCQVPERTKGIDLIEYLPKHHSTNINSIYIHGYIDSLIWRDPKTITDTRIVLKYYAQFLRQDFDQFNRQILRNLISLSTVPNHPLNGDFLSGLLAKQKMTNRDYRWTSLINQDFSISNEQDDGPIHLIINWGWIDMNKDRISAESIRLLCFTLSWFFTSSNRFLRDKATKSLAKVLSENLQLAPMLISYFSKIDDLYIIERVLISTYGAMIRSANVSELGKVAECIYESFFKVKPPLNFLIQYYARQILKLCKEKNIDLKFVSWKRCEPSFGNKIPRIPTIKQLEKRVGDYTKNDLHHKKWGLYAIKSSVTGSGDFARYVLQGDNKSLPWIDNKIKSIKDVEKAFNNDLPKKAKKNYLLYKKYVESYGRIKGIVDWLDDEPKNNGFKSWISLMDKLRTEIIRELTRLQEKKFKKIIDPYLKDINSHREEKHVKSELLQRYVLWRAMQMYNVDKFGAIDRRRDGYYQNGSRSPNKVERIGKKYQWLAYFEAVSLFFDNYKFKPIYDYYGDKFLHISQLTYVDHIDPTILIRSKNDRPYLEKEFGFKFKSSIVPSGGDLLIWLKNQNDLIELQDLISIQDKDLGEWLLIEGHYNFEESIPPEKEKFDEESKRIFYVLNSYLFSLDDLDGVREFIKKTDFIGRWMPENQEMIGIHFGEYGWSDYYKQIVNPICWQSDSRIPFKFKMTNERYLYESGTYDCSMDDTMNISIPSVEIIQGMNLSFGKIDGQFIDKEGSVIAFDLAGEPSGVVIQRDKFSQFLSGNNLGIFWTLLSEKDVLGGDYNHEEWRGRLEYSQGLIFANNSFERIEPIIKFLEPDT